jgi:DMSO reductase family type II enzyme chaperone
VDQAIARTYICRFIAKAFEDPNPDSWHWLTHAQTKRSLRRAIRLLPHQSSHSELDPHKKSAMDPLAAVGTSLAQHLDADRFGTFHDAYLAAFGHAARGPCPLNEIDYGGLQADPLIQPHRLADLAAFYRAFGLQVADDAGERQDHLCLELEFLTVLCAKEAFALQTDPDLAMATRAAQKQFLREHLGRWIPAFASRVADSTADPTLLALTRFARTFIEQECARHGVQPGSADLCLRPVDEAAESLCAGCGVPAEPK